MAWNQPGNNGQDRDPWGSSNNQGGNSGGNGNKGGREQGPPDLDDIFRKLSKKLGGLGGGKGSGSGGNTTQGPRPHMGGRVVGIVAAAVVIIWAATGFYTIKEAERGVVTRFGKFSHLVEPGLNWKPTFIDDVTAVNVESVRELAASGVMLTSDENVVRVEMNVQYRVTDPERYLFSVTSADDSLRQATDSALRGVIGKYTMDRILTEGRTVIRSDTQRELEETIRPYNMGITLLDVNFQAARPPEEVKAAFDDAIAARENEQQYIREAEAYTNEVQPRANGQAQRILEEKERKLASTARENLRVSAEFTLLKGDLMKLAAASKAAAEAGGVVVKLAGLLTDGKFDAWDVFDTLGDQALAQAIQQAVDASTAQKVFAIRASVPEVETTAELGICALGMLGEFLAFWRSDCKRVFLLFR